MKVINKVNNKINEKINMNIGGIANKAGTGQKRTKRILMDNGIKEDVDSGSNNESSNDPVPEPSVTDVTNECVSDLFMQFANCSVNQNNRQQSATDQTELKNHQTQMDCPHCQSCEAVVLEDGNYTCRLCNTVVQRYLDHSAEWRYYGQDDNRRTSDPARCGLPVNELHPSMSSSVLTSSSASHTNFNTASSGGGGTSCYIARYQSWNAMSYRERSLFNVCDQLQTIALHHDFSPVLIDAAKNMYRDVSDRKIFRGDNKSAIVASCLYMACMCNGVPRSPKEIAKIFEIRLQCMTNAAKELQQVLNLIVPPSNPVHFVNRFCCNLGVSDEFAETCRAVVLRASDLDLLSKYTPPSAVAGCIVLCADEFDIANEVTKMKVADVCQVSVVTITKCFNTLANHRASIFFQKKSTTTY